MNIILCLILMSIGIYLMANVQSATLRIYHGVQNDTRLFFIRGEQAMQEHWHKKAAP